MQLGLCLVQSPAEQLWPFEAGGLLKQVCVCLRLCLSGHKWSWSDTRPQEARAPVPAKLAQGKVRRLARSLDGPAGKRFIVGDST